MNIKYYREVLQKGRWGIDVLFEDKGFCRVWAVYVMPIPSGWIWRADEFSTKKEAMQYARGLKKKSEQEIASLYEEAMQKRNKALSELLGAKAEVLKQVDNVL